MAGKKKAALRSGNQTGPKPELSAEFKAHIFKPGQSGNPGGRPKKLTQPLEAFLARKDKSGKQYAQLLIEAMVRRAIKKSDTLIREIFDRVEGHVANTEETSQFRGNVIIVDIPRPPRRAQATGRGMISRRERQATIRQQRPRLKIYTFTALVKRRASLLQRVYETLLAAKVRVIAIFELCPILCPP